jgi:hypothetical protein
MSKKDNRYGGNWPEQQYTTKTQIIKTQEKPKRKYRYACYVRGSRGARR